MGEVKRREVEGQGEQLVRGGVAPQWEGGGGVEIRVSYSPPESDGSGAEQDLVCMRKPKRKWSQLLGS